MKKIIIANWKMQLGFKESEALTKKLKQKMKQELVDVVICPNYLFLAQANSILKTSKIKLGAQNSAIINKGALTGEVSPLNLKELGVKYIILGHSERRTVLNEDSEVINKKVALALETKLIPIVCLGENLLEKESGKAKRVLLSQLKGALKNIKIKKATDLIIAYEPLWAIGTGESIIPVGAEVVHSFLKREVYKILKKNVRVIYGGSVSPDNAKEFLAQNNVDGLLVGGASLKVNSFIKIINY